MAGMQVADIVWADFLEDAWQILLVARIVIGGHGDDRLVYGYGLFRALQNAGLVAFCVHFYEIDRRQFLFGGKSVYGCDLCLFWRVLRCITAVMVVLEDGAVRHNVFRRSAGPYHDL